MYLHCFLNLSSRRWPAVSFTTCDGAPVFTG